MPDHSNRSLKHALAILCIASSAGCAGTGTAHTPVAVRLAVDPSLLEPQPDIPAPAVPAGVAAAAPPEVAFPEKVAIPDPVVVTAPVPPTKKAAPRVAGPAAAAPPVAVAIPPVAVAAPAKIVVERPAMPTLDVASLKSRLRASPAMGVFTKLALQNQMDDLIVRFRDHYRGQKTSGVAYLRPPFDLLVAKVLSELQAGDPSLAHTIGTSREAIWDILSDPVKFASVS